MTAKLLGHTQIQTTARYAHLAPSSVKTIADRSRTASRTTWIPRRTHP